MNLRFSRSFDRLDAHTVPLDSPWTGLQDSFVHSNVIQFRLFAPSSSMRSLFSCEQHRETTPSRERRSVLPCPNPRLKPTIRRIVGRLPSVPSTQDLHQAPVDLNDALQEEFGGTWVTMIGWDTTFNQYVYHPDIERLPNGNWSYCGMVHRGHTAYAVQMKIPAAHFSSLTEDFRT